VIDGSFNQDVIKTFLESTNRDSRYSNLTTLVAVDFFNHDTKVTQPTSGFMPNYNTQISFRNYMDNMYVDHLSNQKMRLEVHMAEASGRNIKLGHCDVLLSELVYGDTTAINGKTTMIERHVSIAPEPAVVGGYTGAGSASLGTLRIKMRLRKPVVDALRFHQGMTQVKDTTRAAGSAPGKPGSDPSEKHIVTISV